jgi:hypothetical protein
MAIKETKNLNPIYVESVLQHLERGHGLTKQTGSCCAQVLLYWLAFLQAQSTDCRQLRVV